MLRSEVAPTSAVFRNYLPNSSEGIGDARGHFSAGEYEEGAKAMSEANQFELNKGDNFIFAVDVSGSMAANDCPGNMTRIEFLKEKGKLFDTKPSK